MATRKTYHVTKKDDVWRVAGENSQRADSLHSTKASAVERAKELAKAQPLGQVIIHKQDGKFQTEHTYGKDPYPPEG
jgi:hypothetical protein